MKVCVIGTGYVGLVAGAGFAEYGNDVICVDNNERKIENLKKGILPIYEPGLEEIVKRTHREGRLLFTTDLAEGVRKSKIIFIAVGTPSSHDGQADLSMVLAVAKAIGQSLNGYKVIVDKSTVPVGTAEKVKAAIAAETQEEFAVVSNPEFLKEGMAVNDFIRPERVVIGADDERARDLMNDLYAPFVANGNPILNMSVKSAEVTKYAANAFLATKISFANEIANLCDHVGADYNEVRRGMGSDSRIGKKFLYAGIGYGGSCFPKDVRALLRTAEAFDSPLRILSKVEEVNENQKRILLAKMDEHFGSADQIKGKLFGVWGLAFKPGTDDMREAPSIPIIKTLLERGAKIQAFDPVARETAGHEFGDSIEYCDHDFYQAAEGADALLILTDWPEFRRPDFEMLGQKLKNKLIFDGRNQYNPGKMRELGYTYYGIGTGLPPVRT